jgi:hypothetical protein
VDVNEIVLSGGLSSGDDQVAEKIGEISDERSDSLRPRLELKGSGAEIVVEDHTALRELDLGHGANLTVESDSIFRKGGTEGPHEGEAEESLIDDLHLLLELIRHLL